MTLAEHAMSPPRREVIATAPRSSPRAKVRRGRGLRRLGWLVLVVLVIFARPALRHAQAAALLLGLAGPSSPLDRVPLLRAEIGVESAAIPLEVASGKTADVRTRIYLPMAGTTDAPVLAGRHTPHRGLVLAHGVHYLGIDEPRLVGLAKSFARAGYVVLTPELAGLADYRVEDPGNLATLRASVEWLARRDDLVLPGGVGLVGISFAGGLSLRVAELPGLEGSLAFVGSIGGHHDLERVARFFVTDKVATPSGEIDWRAHDYGLAVLVYDSPARFVPPADVPALRDGVRAFLHESYPTSEMASLRLSPEAHWVWERVYRRDRLALRDRVLAALPELREQMRAASPAGHIADIKVPIFVLHGAHDDVVPPSEARWIEAEARPGQPISVLVSERLGHAELGKKEDPRETWRLLHWMAALLEQQ
jgi:dienelactone hydrolase